jgi:hypothetical protein
VSIEAWALVGVVALALGGTAVAVRGRRRPEE